MTDALPWEVVRYEYDDLPQRNHVIPKNDLREHEGTLKTRRDEVRSACWCGADIDEHGVVIHHSMDGREKLETAGAKPQ